MSASVMSSKSIEETQLTTSDEIVVAVQPSLPLGDAVEAQPVPPDAIADLERQEGSAKAAVPVEDDRSKRSFLLDRTRRSRDSESNDEASKRKVQEAERKRKRRLSETPDEAAERRAMEAKRKREMRSKETPEEAQARRKANAERQRRRRSLETPEEAQARRTREAMQKRARRAELKRLRQDKEAAKNGTLDGQLSPSDSSLHIPSNQVITAPDSAPGISELSSKEDASGPTKPVSISVNHPAENSMHSVGIVNDYASNSDSKMEDRTRHEGERGQNEREDEVEAERHTEKESERDTHHYDSQNSEGHKHSEHELEESHRSEPRILEGHECMMKEE